MIEYMRGIKAIFDPNNILNPKKVLPERKEEENSAKVPFY